MRALQKRVLRIEQATGDFGDFLADQIRQLVGIAPKRRWLRPPRVTPEIQQAIDQMIRRLNESNEDARQSQ